MGSTIDSQVLSAVNGVTAHTQDTNGPVHGTAIETYLTKHGYATIFCDIGSEEIVRERRNMSGFKPLLRYIIIQAYYEEVERLFHEKVGKITKRIARLHDDEYSGDAFSKSLRRRVEDVIEETAEAYRIRGHFVKKDETIIV